VADARGVVHDDLVLVSGQHIPEHGEDNVNSSTQASKLFTIAHPTIRDFMLQNGIKDLLKNTRKFNLT
jgi:hypothetical protein